MSATVPLGAHNWIKNVSPLYKSVINSQKSFGLDNLKTITALKPFLYFLKQ